MRADKIKTCALVLIFVVTEQFFNVYFFYKTSILERLEYHYATFS